MQKIKNLDNETSSKRIQTLRRWQRERKSMAEEAGTEDASPPLAGAEGGGGDDDDDGGGSEAIPETRAVAVEEEEEVRDLKKLNGKRWVEEEEASEGTNDLHRSARLPLPIFPSLFLLLFPEKIVYFSF